MEDYLGNVTIGKVYKGKAGDGEYGPWQAWNFYVEGDERKFSYFSGGKKPEPFEGAFIKMAKFETVTKGQYTNHNIKEMALEDQNNETQQDSPYDYEPPGEPTFSRNSISKPVVKQSLTPRSDEKISFYVSYAKDLQVARITMGHISNDVTLFELAGETMAAGLAMHKMANGGEVPF